MIHCFTYDLTIAGFPLSCTYDDRSDHHLQPTQPASDKENQYGKKNQSDSLNDGNDWLNNCSQSPNHHGNKNNTQKVIKLGSLNSELTSPQKFPVVVLSWGLLVFTCKYLRKRIVALHSCWQKGGTRLRLWITIRTCEWRASQLVWKSCIRIQSTALQLRLELSDSLFIQLSYSVLSVGLSEAKKELNRIFYFLQQAGQHFSGADRWRTSKQIWIYK